MVLVANLQLQDNIMQVEEAVVHHLLLGQEAQGEAVQVY